MSLLIWLGLVRRSHTGELRGPFYISPWHIWKVHFLHGPRFGLFRNRPGVINRVPGSLLPRRWGFFIVGFEFGQRG